MNKIFIGRNRVFCVLVGWTRYWHELVGRNDRMPRSLQPGRIKCNVPKLCTCSKLVLNSCWIWTYDPIEMIVDFFNSLWFVTFVFLLWFYEINLSFLPHKICVQLIVIYAFYFLLIKYCNTVLSRNSFAKNATINIDIRKISP